jgi:hypothetical protein
MRRLIISSVCAGLLLSIYSAPAQTPTGPASRRPDPIQGELQRRFEAEAIEKVLSTREKPPTAPERGQVIEQIKEDFLRIQIVDDELQKEKGRDELDLGAISKYVFEIKRRSERLRQNLSLRKVSIAKSSVPDVETIEHLRRRIAFFSKEIEDFVANPMFESAKIVNTDLSTRASIDLEQIIVSSKEIKLLSDRLRRIKSSRRIRAIRKFARKDLVIEADRRPPAPSQS